MVAEVADVAVEVEHLVSCERRYLLNFRMKCTIAHFAFIASQNIIRFAKHKQHSAAHHSNINSFLLAVCVQCRICII